MAERREMPTGEGRPKFVFRFGSDRFGPNPRGSNNDERDETARADDYRARLITGGPQWTARQEKKLHQEIVEIRVIVAAAMGGGTLAGVIGYLLNR